MKITDQRWNEAQEAERKCHDNLLNRDGVESVRAHYSETYAKYFKFLDITQDQTPLYPNPFRQQRATTH